MSMPNKFDKAKSAKTFSEVAKTSKETAVVSVIKIIKNENLVDYINNSEDIDDTADLERSIKELGFIDPIEVTDYGMTDGKYMIVSGHRRRNAGVKRGMKSFPCLVKPFKNDAEVQNYVLLANSQRDSSKDPLLIAKRYRKHKEYLISQGQATGFREEIAQRLGLSAKQADRYNRLLDIIPEVWSMIQSNIVGMSNVLKMSSHSEEEQRGILDMLMDCHNEGSMLTREKCESIISAYNNGIKSYDEIKKTVNTKLDNAADDEDEVFVHDENLYDVEGIDNAYDEQLGESSQNASEDNFGGTKFVKDEIINGDNNANSEKEVSYGTRQKEDNKPLSNIEQRKQKGLNINKIIETLEANFNEFYIFDSEDTAALTMRTMQGVIKVMIAELEHIGENYNNMDLFNKGIKDLFDNLKTYDVT